MLTTRDAARLLAAVGHDAPLASLTGALGFATPLQLPRRDSAPLSPGDPPTTAFVAAGTGALRALLVEWDDGPPLRDRLPLLARALVARSPAQLWLLVARHRGHGALAVAAPGPSRRDALPALILDLAQLRESDAETFAALDAVRRDGDGPERSVSLVHLQWRETLGREALTRRFYRDLEQAVDRLATTATGRGTAEERGRIALLCTSRLLFLAFLEAKGWLDRDRAFLRHQMERLAGTAPQHATLHGALLEPLWFGTLNTPVHRRARAARAFGAVPFLNGGLFQRTAVETRRRTLRLGDDAIAAVIGELLPRYRLTAREQALDLSDAAVDPEMLGRAFESLMGNASRRAQGAFYTPQPLIARITGGALRALLERAPAPALAAIRVVDPACGSGAFLVHALESIAALRLVHGDARPLSAVRREVLARSIFGVDLDPTAVWLCQLRLWLSVVVEDDRDDPMRLPPLPNLDRNVREGDALAGRAFEDARLPDGAELTPLRLRYARASGARKRTLARALDRAERRRAIAAAEQRLSRLTDERRELLLTARSPDLFRTRRAPDAATQRALTEVRGALRASRAQLRALRDGGALPFSFATHFPDVAASGGFDLVLGNPPWVRPHALAVEQRVALRERFETFRLAAWTAGAEAAGAGRGFASQADLAALFVERSVALARPDGVIALLLPSKLWCALSGGGLRDLLMRRTTLLALDDWTGDAAGFDAVVYPSALLARHAPGPGRELLLTLHGARGTTSWSLPLAGLPLDGSIGAPWLLRPPQVRAAFDRVSAAGVPLAQSDFGRPLLGVKSGCNEAFVVNHLAPTVDPTSEPDREPDQEPGRPPSDDAALTHDVRAAERTGTIERALLRPLVRGEHVRAWQRSDDAADSAIIWTHDARGAPLDPLPPHAQRWLLQWRRRLADRSDGRGGRWWALFRTEAARTDRPRVVWGDIGRRPRALTLPAGDRTVPLNSCYVAIAPTDEDAFSLCALINSPLAAAWLNVIAEPARGGYRRYLGWTCARLPLPRDWAGARRLLAPLGAAGHAGRPPADDQLLRASCAAYDLAPGEIAALLEWDRA